MNHHFNVQLLNLGFCYGWFVLVFFLSHFFDFPILRIVNLSSVPLGGVTRMSCGCSNRPYSTLGRNVRTTLAPASRGSKDGGVGGEHLVVVGLTSDRLGVVNGIAGRAQARIVCNNSIRFVTLRIPSSSSACTASPGNHPTRGPKDSKGNSYDTNANERLCKSGGALWRPTSRCNNKCHRTKQNLRSFDM